MNLVDINEMISKYENTDASLSTIRNLAALYFVREHITNTRDKTANEISDILPSYLRYVEAKKEYQMGEIQSTQVLAYLKILCQETCEFVQTLYSTTDVAEERILIKEMTNTIQKILALPNNHVV